MKLEIKETEFNHFRKALKKAVKDTDDLSPVLREHATRFLKSRNFIFDKNRVGTGQYAPLSEKYAKRKKRVKGFIHPILFYGGKLKKSITKKGGNNILNISKKSLIIGSKLKYARAHQLGSNKTNLPQREFLFWGPESPAHANIDLVKKVNKQLAVSIFQFVERKTGKGIKASVDNANRRYDELFK